MSALQKIIYKHMQQKGILLTDGSEKDKKVCRLSFIPILKSQQEIASLFYYRRSETCEPENITCQWVKSPKKQSVGVYF